MTTTGTEPRREVVAKRRRGRESVGDMVRSLGLVLLLVGALWFLAQPPASDKASIRVVDPTADIAQLQQAAPGTPAPRGLPAGWRPTSSTPDAEGLRIGYVTPDDQYAEYAVAASGSPDFLTQITGQGAEVGVVQVDGQPWRQFTGRDDATSLVREQAGRTIVVGGARETTSLDELLALAGSVG